MKGMCYIVLIVGFFLFYQQNPIYAIFIIGGFIGVYLFYKSKTSSSGSGIMSFLSGKPNTQDSKIDDLITLMVVQQFLNTPSSNHDSNISKIEKKKSSDIEITKQEILRLLEE